MTTKTALLPAIAAQDHAYKWLKEHVARLPRYEGTFLTEGEVAQSTGLSRTPVREALLRLEAEGLLQIVPKKGAFVPPITDAGIEAVMQARSLVEDWCIRRATLLDGSLPQKLEALVRRQKGLRNTALGFIEWDREFHRAIVRAAGNPVLAEFYESLRDRQLRMGLRAIAASKQRSLRVLEEHVRIVEGIRAGNPEAAAAALAEHLARTLAVLRLPSVTHWLAETEDQP